MALTNVEMADRLEVDHSTVSKIRSGTRLPSLDLMLRMEKEYGVDLRVQVAAREKGPMSVAELWNHTAHVEDLPTFE